MNAYLACHYSYIMQIGMFRKKEWNISQKRIKVAEEQYCSRDVSKLYEMVMEMEKSTDSSKKASLAMFLLHFSTTTQPVSLFNN